MDFYRINFTVLRIYNMEWEALNWKYNNTYYSEMA